MNRTGNSLASRSDPGTERRCQPRVKGGGTATVVHAGRLAGSYPVRNLSASGALLVGDGGPAEGQLVRVLLDLGSGRWVNLAALVVRHHQDAGGQRAFALSFQNLSPQTQDRIQQHVLRLLELEATADPSVLLLGNGRRLGRIGRTLKGLGTTTCTAATPLEAIATLDARPTIDTMIVDIEAGRDDALELLSFVGADRPGVWRVVVSRETSSNLADAVLQPPCSDARVAFACRLRRGG